MLAMGGGGGGEKQICFFSFLLIDNADDSCVYQSVGSMCVAFLSIANLSQIISIIVSTILQDKPLSLTSPDWTWALI